MTTATWRTRMDNYGFRREAWAHGELKFTTNALGDPVVTVTGADQLKDWQNSNYIIDDGSSARIMYVAGFQPAGNVLFLDDIPVNPDRTDFYDTWALGPKRTYHLKVKPMGDQS